MTGPEQADAPREKPRVPEFAIARDGTWFHRGSAVKREALVRLLAGLLRRQGDTYVLQTPEQRIRVEVEDAPFVAVALEVHDPGPAQELEFTLAHGDRVRLDPAHPLRMRGGSGEDCAPRPYLQLDGGLEALVNRNVFYRLVDLAVCEPADGRLGVRSGGAFFPLE